MNKKIFLGLALFLILSVSVVMAQDAVDNLTAADDNGTDEIAVSEDETALADNPTPIDVLVKKVWDDDGSSGRPDSVSFNITIDGNTMGPYNLTAADKWEYTFHNIDSDAEISIVEDNVSGYESKVTGDINNGFTITNTLNNDTSQKDDTTDDSTDDGASNEDSSDDGTTDQSGKDTKSPTKKIKKTAVKKVPKKKNKSKPIKDKHNTGYPILLGLLAVSTAGLAIIFRRKE